VEEDEKMRQEWEEERRRGGEKDARYDEVEEDRREDRRWIWE